MTIAIEITDKVSPAVSRKITNIGTSARAAHTAVQELKAALSTINDSALNRLLRETTTSSSRLSSTVDKAALSSQRLAKEQANAALAAQRLQTETQRTATATANAAAAQARAQAATDRLTQSQNRAADAAQRHAKGLDTLKGAITGLGLAVVAGNVIKLADSYTNLNNKLQNISSSQEHVNVLNARMFELANRTRSDVDATATAYTRFDRALKIMGRSQEDTFRMTETVNKGLIVSGSTATEAASTLLQLSQAFNAGKAQGDEFRALAENFPMIMDATAKAMGVTVDQVKKLSTEGKVTSKVLFDALKILESQVDATFAKTTPTISQAGVVLRNSMTEATGQMDKALGVTAALASGILLLADNMDILAPAVVGVGTAFAVAFGPQLLRVLNLATGAVKAFTVALASNPIGLIAVALTSLGTALAMYMQRTRAATEETAIFRDYVVAAFSYIQDAWKAVTEFFAAAWNRTVKYLSDLFTGWGTSVDEVMAAVNEAGKLYANSLIKIWQVAFETVSFVWSNFPSLMKNFFVAVYNFSAGVVESVVNSWQIGMKLIADSIEGFAPDAAAGIREVLKATKLELDRLDYSQDGLDATQNYLDRLKDIFAGDPIGEFADDWAKRASTATADRLKIAAEQADALRKAGAGAPTTPDADKGRGANRKFTYEDAVRELERETKLLQMNRLERERLSVVNQLEDKLGKDRNGKRIEFNDAQRKTLEGMVREQELLRNRAAILDEIQAPEQRLIDGQLALNSLLNDGSITAQQFADNMRDLSIAFLETQTSMESGFQRGILKAQKDMGDLSQLTESFVTNGVKNLEDAFVSLAVNGKMNFADFAKSIVSDLMRIAVRAMITRAILMAIGAIGGSIGYQGMGMSAMSNASGMGGSLESFMNVPAQGFATGGWTGNGANNEIAGVVHRNEFVVKAGAAQSNREILEAMNRGASFDSALQSSDASLRSAPSVVVKPEQKMEVVIQNNDSGRVNVRTQQERGPEGQMRLAVMVDMVEEQLSNRMASGRGPLYNSTRQAFGLNSNPKGQ